MRPAREPRLRSEAFAAHRATSSALFALFCLLAITLSVGDPRLFAVLAGGSLLSGFLLTRDFAGGLGSFASPLAVLVDQVLLWAAIAPMGGAQSLFAVLLPAGVALAWQLEGKSAARFYAVLSLAGIGGLLALRALPLSSPGLFPLLLTALAAPALLVALEAVSRRGTAAQVGRPAGKPAAVAQETHAAVAEESTAPSTAPRAETAPARRYHEAILHDLKSPLSVMRVYTDLIAEGARRGELPNPEHLTNLSREIELAERLVGSTGEPGPTAENRAAPERGARPSGEAATPSADLVEILGSLATAYRLSLGGRRRIEFIAEKPELPVAADPVALQRAFRNVLENAVKYTPEGGEIRIRAGPAGPHAFVVFKDTGIGMTPEERTHAFDYAFRGSAAIASGARGKGIGLAVTKEILESNGGRISLSSEAGFGSEVTILLPFSRGAR
jgi:signal transduction histidine kinase